MSTTLRETTLTLTGSLPGPDCPLPTFAPQRALPPMEVGDDASPEMAARIRFGRLQSPLPYARQGDYDRARSAVEIPALVLENEHLSATLLPSLGGRLWSLRDLTQERDLLFVNPVLQCANFGLTDAWFAGGIEWNLGSTGHWTLSSRPLHAAQISTPTGVGVRLWEWERTRDLILQLDFALEGDRLLVSTRVINPDPEPKPLYYWTNIAIPETPQTRVLSQASHAWRTDYSGRLTRVPVPHPDGPEVDISYPMRSVHSADYFFETPAPGRFVAAIEPDGHGFAQTSTDALQGRKLFLWGNAAGGARWQEWLSGPGARYAEIQAGWCTTQMEHDVIAGHSEVSWTEAFGGVTVDPDAVADPFAQAAEVTSQAVLDDAAPEHLTAHHAEWLASTANSAPECVLHVASGWGGAEIALRADAGEPARLPGEALPFPTAAVEQVVLAGLGRDTGQNHLFGDVVMPPVSDRWAAALAAARWDEHAWVRYARGVQAQVRGEAQVADAEYTAAIASAATAGTPAPLGAIRGRALLAAERGDEVAARDFYAQALAAGPDVRTLLSEALMYLLSIDEPAAVLSALDAAPAEVVGHGRNRLLRARALLALGQREAAAILLPDLDIPDLAEGGREITELWRDVHPDEPLPPHLDFRMQAN